MNETSRRETQLKELVAVAALINSSLDSKEIRRRVVEASARLTGAERASLLLAEKRGGRLFFEVALGEGAQALESVRLVRGEGIAGAVAEACRPEIVNDVRTDPRHLSDADAETGFTTRSMLCIPIVYRESTLGVLEIINKVDGDFTDDDLELGSALANHIGVALENARLYEGLRRSYLETWVYAALLATALIASGAWLISLTS